ncbi:MAG: TonB-dependent receptor domain-containing protein [Weeksellaceae bacterium]
MIKFYTIVLSLLLFSSLWAQNVNVSGTVVEDTGLPAAYVNISFDGLQDNSEIFESTMTDENGNFNIDIIPGRYIMVIQPLSGNIIEREEEFTQDINLGDITITASIDLGRTVAVGDKPLYRLELDKRVYDMSRDVTTRGASLSDALNNVPSVQVDGEGTLSLRGNENVKVLINGKPSALTGISNVGDALRNIQADQVERVEVITNPSARYDAEGSGGIINIVLKKGTRHGFNGSISTNIGVPLTAGINADLNYRTEKWNFFISPSISYGEGEGVRDFKNYRYYDQAPDTIEFQNGKPFRKRRYYGGSIGLEHFLTDKTTLSTSMNLRLGDDTSDNDTYTRQWADDLLIAESVRSLDEQEDEFDIEGNIGFKHEFNSEGHVLDIQASGSWSEESEYADIRDIASLGNQPDEFEKNINDETRRRWQVQADYVLPMEGDARFEIGSKIELEDNMSDFSVEKLIHNQWVLSEGLTDKLTNTQHIFAAYTQYGKRFGKFSYLAGLRVENSDILIESENANNGLGSKNEKNYTNWFPSATLNYYIDDAEKNQLQLSYSKRIRRPRGWWLSPFRSRSDDRNIFQGNPDLDPVISQNFELSYITQINKTTLTPSIYYQKSEDDMTVLRTLREQEGKTVFLSMPVNAGDEERYGAELVASTQLAPWWKAFGNLNLFGYKTTGSYYVEENNKTYDLSGDGFSWFGRISNNISLPQRINMQLNGFYFAGQDNAQSNRDPMWGVDLGLTKDILNGDGTLSFNVRDIFNTRRRKAHNFGENYDSYMDMQWRPRTYTLNFTYRINQKKNRERGNREGLMDEGEGMEM